MCQWPLFPVLVLRVQGLDPGKGGARLGLEQIFVAFEADRNSDFRLTLSGK